MVQLSEKNTDGTIDTTADIPDDLDTIGIGRSNAGSFQPACLIRNLRIYSDPDVNEDE